MSATSALVTNTKRSALRRSARRRATRPRPLLNSSTSRSQAPSGTYGGGGQGGGEEDSGRSAVRRHVTTFLRSVGRTWDSRRTIRIFPLLLKRSNNLSQSGDTVNETIISRSNGSTAEYHRARLLSDKGDDASLAFG